jgi:hypothetical protein
MLPTFSLLFTIGSCVVIPREAAPPWPLENPGRYAVEDFPFLDIVERTSTDPYLYLGKPDFGYPSIFRCLPVCFTIRTFMLHDYKMTKLTPL